MAEIEAKLRLRTATVKIGDNSYTAHIQDFTYKPTPVTSEVTDVGGKVVKFSGEAGWVLDLNVFQDFTDTGLARKMLEDEGTKVEIVIADGPTTWTSEVELVAPTIGGATKQVGVSTVSLPSSRPVASATAAPGGGA